MPIRDIQMFFKYGLDRDLPPLAQPPNDGKFPMKAIIELGPGKKKVIPGVTWRYGIHAERHFDNGKHWVAPGRLPLADRTVKEIHAYQFFEHLDGHDVVKVLRECERVLCKGGVLNMVTPYYNSAHMAQALDHKSFWSEETWHWMFGNEYYDDHEEHGWELKVHICFIMGIVERNIDLFTQLVKE